MIERERETERERQGDRQVTKKLRDTPGKNRER